MLRNFKIRISFFFSLALNVVTSFSLCSFLHKSLSSRVSPHRCCPRSKPPPSTIVVAINPYFFRSSSSLSIFFLGGPALLSPPTLSLLPEDGFASVAYACSLSVEQYCCSMTSSPLLLPRSNPLSSSLRLPAQPLMPSLLSLLLNQSYSNSYLSLINFWNLNCLPLLNNSISLPFKFPPRCCLTCRDVCG